MKSCPTTRNSRQISDLILFSGVAILVWLLMTGCARIGREFPIMHIAEIKINKTTQQEIRNMFGPPWRVGNEDGLRTWTYGRYIYRVFGEESTQDLVIRFDEHDVVVSFIFNTTEHSEKPGSPQKR